jgi:hypothetical protein
MNSLPADPTDGAGDQKTEISVNAERPADRTAGVSFRPALSVAVLGFDDAEAMHTQMDAGDLDLLLSRLGTFCAVAASEFGGKLVNHPGGEKVLVFGFPLPHELDAERAVLAVQKILRTFEWNGSKCPALLRCGLASGEGFLKVDPGPNTSPCEVSGSVYEEASRLLRHAPGNVLLVSPDAQALFRSNFKARKVNLGDESDIAFEVSPAVSPATRFDTGEQENRLASFMGRGDELAALETTWDEVRSGKSRSVLIRGEPGIGKSRLLHAFLQTVGTGQPLVFTFAGSSHHRRTPFFPVARGLLGFLGLKGFQSPTLLDMVVRNLLADLDLETPRHTANLKAVLRAGSLDLQPFQHERSADNPAETLQACFQALSLIHPVILVFEDAHWMDNSTLDLARTLCDAPRDCPILTLISSRSGPIATSLTTSATLICRLRQLTRDQTRALATALRPSGLSDTCFEQIVGRSDGIPLYLEELMNVAAEFGSAFFDTSLETHIPASLRETLAARLSHLGDKGEVLMIAAVIGKSFDIRLLADVAGLSENQLYDHLAAFQKSDLVYRLGAKVEGQFEFKHSLVQDLAYQSLAPSARSHYHHRIAEALTRQEANYPPAAAEVIARHFERGGNVARALDYLELAGIEAVQIAAHKEAGRYFNKALDLAADIASREERDRAVNRFLLLLGPQLITNHGFASEEVYEVYTRARSLTSTESGSPEVLRMLWGLWGAHVVKADIAFARELAEEFLRFARARGDALELAAGHYMAGVGAFYIGDLVAAERSLLVAVRSALEADFDEMITKYSLDLGILALSYLCWCFALAHRPDKLAETSMDLETAALLSDHAFCQAFSYCFLATTQNFLGNGPEAERHALAAARLSRKHGFAQQLAQAEINLGRARVIAGDPSGLNLMEHGLAAYLATGAVLARPYAEAWIAEALLRRNRPDAALSRLVEVRRFTVKSGERYYDAELLRLSALATSAARPDALHRIRTLLDKSASHARRTGIELHLSNALLQFRGLPAL